jgi:hypothetical protein
MDTWKPVVGYEGIYEVSDNGDIRTSDGKTTYTEKHGIRHWSQRVLKQKTDKYGYKRVTLYKDGKPKDFLVHRLVAEVFCEKQDDKPIINHIDGKPDNNIADNLEWCDYRHNLIHAFKNGMNKSPNKTVLTNKLTGEKLEFISMAEASQFIGCNKGYISSLVKRGKNETKEWIIS